jgi:hypothetical protein
VLTFRIILVSVVIAKINVCSVFLLKSLLAIIMIVESYDMLTMSAELL